MDKKNIHNGHRLRLYDFVLSSKAKGHDINLIETFLTFIIPRKDVNPLAHKIFDKFKSFSKFVNADMKSLKEIEELSDTATKKILVFGLLMQKHNLSSTPQTKIELLKELETFIFENKNDCLVFMLSNKNQIINFVQYDSKMISNQQDFSIFVNNNINENSSFDKLLVVIPETNLNTVYYVNTLEKLCEKLDKDFYDLWIADNEKIFSVRENKILNPKK